MDAKPARCALAATALLLTTVALSACTSPEADPGPVPSSTAAAPTASTTAEPDAQGDGAQGEGGQADLDALPIGRDEIATWAEEAVAPAGAEGRVLAQHGWLGEGTTTSTTMSAADRPEGRYVVQVACLGEGTITVRTTEPADAASPGEPDASCSGGTVRVDAEAGPEGPTVLLGLEGAPTAYAVAVDPAPEA